MKRTKPLFLIAILFASLMAGCAQEMVVVTATPSPAPTATPTEVPTPRPTPWNPAAPEAPCEPSETRSCSVLFVLPRSGFAHWASRLPRGFEEAGYEIIVASRAPTIVNSCGGGNSQMEVDLQLTDVDVEEYDAVVFVGGSGCQSQWSDTEAHRIAQDAVEHEVVLGAIGCAPTILAYAGVLEGAQSAVCQMDAAVKRGLDYSEVLEELGAIYAHVGITRDGLIITARARSYQFVPGILETLAAR